MPPSRKASKSPQQRREMDVGLAGARPGVLARKPVAQLATLVARPPEGDEWLHEIKFDGYRVLARLEDGRAQLWTRNGNDWTGQFAGIAAAVERLGARTALLDGEVVVQLPDGRTSFQALQNAAARSDLLYYVFDLLYLDGLDLTAVQQDARKEALLALISELPGGGPLRYSDHVIGQGAEFLRQACGAGLEGIVSKRRRGHYRGGRGGEWVKAKCLQEQEFVVIGYTDPAGSRQDLGALLIGTYENGRLVYRGKVGTGFSADVLRDLRRRLQPFEQSEPVVGRPAGARWRGVHWVRPQMVVQVAFTEITSDGVLRHPTFRGIREDKAPADVVMERPPAGPAVSPTSAGKGAAPPASGRDTPAPPRRAAVRQPEPAPASRTGARRELELAGVRITNPDKVLYPERGLTKEALARYYLAVAEWLVPHISGRPLTLVRCPQGHTGGCFFQKHMDEVDSPHVRRIRVKEAEGARDYRAVYDAAGLLVAVQLGALELHTWNSRADRLTHPDRVTLDIDPDPTVTWDDTVQAAHEIWMLLRELELECFVKTTGGKGLHVVIPLVRHSGWEDVRDFSRALVAAVAAASPTRYTLQLSKARRKGRLLLDYLRNTRGATAVEVYSTRARPGAPVSTPVSWEELAGGVSPLDFTLETVPARLAAGTDPWRDYSAVMQSLTAPLKRRLGLR